MSATCATPVKDDTLLAWWAGELSAPGQDQLEEHLLSCDECAGRGEALAAVAESLASVAYAGLCAMERTALNFTTSLAGMLVMLVASLALTPLWGITGAAGGLLAGKAMTAALQFLAFMYLTTDSKESQVSTAV